MGFSVALLTMVLFFLLYFVSEETVGCLLDLIIIIETSNMLICRKELGF